MYRMEGIAFSPAVAGGIEIKLDIVKGDVVPFPAGRALAAPALLGANEEQHIDPAVSLDGRRGYGHHLCVVECGGTGRRQRPGVTLGTGGQRPAVHLVAQYIPGRGRGQCRRALAADHRQHTAGKGLLQDGVSGVPAAHFGHLGPQRIAVPDHRGNTQTGEFLGVVQVWLDIQHTARVLVDDVADDVELHLRLAHLGHGHH